jgi:hypothetical protein
MNRHGVTDSRRDKRLDVEECLTNLREALLGLRYGSIAITVHEDRIVQIDVTERKRLTAN